jgi:pilus assembly protein TadC
MTIRAVGAVAATGVVSFILLKLLAAVTAPLVGMFFSFMVLAFKVGLAVGVVYFLYRMFRRRQEEEIVA